MFHCEPQPQHFFIVLLDTSHAKYLAQHLQLVYCTLRVIFLQFLIATVQLTLSNVTSVVSNSQYKFILRADMYRAEVGASANYVRGEQKWAPVPAMHDLRNLNACAVARSMRTSNVSAAPTFHINFSCQFEDQIGYWPVARIWSVPVGQQIHRSKHRYVGWKAGRSLETRRH